VAVVPPAPMPLAPASLIVQSLPLRPVPIPAELSGLRQPRFDQIADIIEKAEASFEAGRRDYRAGHLEVAKSEFNAAIDSILQGPVSMQEDRRLAKEFDSLVDRIHAYELQALRQGDGFTDPTKYQPAPLDELQALTFPDNPQLRDRVRADAANTVSDLPLVVNNQVANFIEYFAHGRGRSSLEAGLRRSGRFHDMIVRILKEEGVPLDLIYLAQAESAFQYYAKSNKGATGIWQFMAGTSRPYGLETSWWLDERLNPEKATRAAAKHLRDLHAMFGDWYLALAAYNSGPVTVQNAVERTGYADFWELSARHALPEETRNYVPIILALTIVAKNPEKYGIDNLLPEAPLVYDAVTVTEPVDLRLVAEIVGSSVETLRELNPSLLRMTTPKVPEYDLRIPLATKDIFVKRIAMIPADKRVWWRWHTVAYGETLSGIAKKLHSTPQAIAEVNNIDTQQPLREAAELVIPVSGYGGGEISHEVHAKETLASIARRYKVSTEDLVSWNNLSGQSVRPGMMLSIYKDSSAPSRPVVSTASHVASGSLKSKTTQIAARHKAATSTRAAAKPPMVYKVRQGDSLAQIAANHNVSVQVLKQHNHIGDSLRVGAEIIIPVAR
jgi:membrane-bound lytic murein transglycosylase D